VDVEFAGFLDVLLHAVEEDCGDEVLGCGGLRGDEDLSCCESSVRCPGFGTGDGEEYVPRWKRRKNFEWFG
jgi:hypothetical protein